MDNNYNKGKDHGAKVAEVVKKTPVAVVIYPAGFVVGFVSAFVPKKKSQPVASADATVEVETQPA